MRSHIGHATKSHRSPDNSRLFQRQQSQADEDSKRERRTKKRKFNGVAGDFPDQFGFLLVNGRNVVDVLAGPVTRKRPGSIEDREIVEIRVVHLGARTVIFEGCKAAVPAITTNANQPIIAGTTT